MRFKEFVRSKEKIITFITVIGMLYISWWILRVQDYSFTLGGDKYSILYFIAFIIFMAFFVKSIFKPGSAPTLLQKK